MALHNFAAVIGLLLLLVAPAWAAPTVPVFDTPRALLEALYAPYGQGDSFDWTVWDETQFRSAHLNELIRKDAIEAGDQMGRLDFDPYINGQDYQVTDLVIGDARIDGDKATEEVTFRNFDRPQAMTFTLVKEADGWKIDDMVSADKDFPYSLKAIMEGPIDW